MHIPDGFLSAGVAASTWAAGAAGIAVALRAERRETSPMPAGILGAVAAFVFAAQMVNVPVAPGTSGHLIGATLATVLLGPWRAMLAMTAVLAVQALLFQDGGITAFGANLIDMGWTGCLVGYALARVTSRGVRGPRGVAAGAVVGAFIATLCSAVLAAIWLSLSGLYPLPAILPVMLVTHVAIGLLEAALTGAVLVAVLRWRPDLANGIGSNDTVRRPVAQALGWLGAALLIVAFIAPFASSLPDGLEQSAGKLGIAGLATSPWPTPMSDYTLPWARLGRLAPMIAGAIGVVAVAAMAWTISRSLAIADDASHR